VYGSVLTDNLDVVHMRATNFKERDRMCGSKYVQSKLADTFKSIKCDLDEGRKVLFSGTSCQIAGLQKYLGRKYETLLCVDIVCHGVPSPKVWREYIAWQERNTGKIVTSVDFRNKCDYGWAAHIETLIMSDGTRVDSHIYRDLFYSHVILRPSCFKCPYKSIHHPGDITIADYWGIDKAAPGFNDNKGVSLVLLNNEKANDFFERIKENLTWKETRIEDSMQPPLVAPFPMPKERKQFWKDFATKDFSYIVGKYNGRVSATWKIVKKLKSLIKK
jgi:coenzyme F420-reducing hydrogenase beta subunit